MTPEKFREAREELRLTQTMLADRIGVTKHTIINLEKGRTPLRAVYVEALASVAAKVADEMSDRARTLQSVR